MGPPPLPPNKPSALRGLPQGRAGPPKKRMLLWDWTSTRDKLDITPFLQSPYISSVSNWNAWSPPDIPANTVPFYPMLRVEAGLSGDDWNMIASNPHSTIQYLNEPDRFQPPMSPETAAQKYLDQMVPLVRKQQGKKLVSPAVASDPAGTQWLERFLKIVIDAGEAPDFLALHYYGADEGEGAMGYLGSMHAKWPQLPVLVTEIACISRDGGTVERFTAKVTNWLDSQDWVSEYAWFGCMRDVADGFVSPQAQLMDKDGKATRLMSRLMTECPMKV